MFITLDFKTATGRLLSKVEIEQEIGRFQFRFRRPPPDDEEKGSGFERKASFGIPIPYDQRPISADGKVSFYFDHSTITKRREAGKSGGKVGPDGLEPVSNFVSDAQDHDKYLTREKAVLRVTEADYEKYIGRDEALAKDEEAQLAILSNISDDERVRENFWKAVTRCERKASPDQVTLYGDRLSRPEWESIRDIAAAPAELQDAANQMIKYHDLLAEDPHRREAAKVTIELDRIHFHAVRRLLRRSKAWDRKRPAATIKKGRGGRTQQRIVAAIPAGLNIVSMLRILRLYCDYLDSRKVMYTAVIHAPDYHNDERNYHLHLAYYERPCRWLTDKNCWDFEYREPVPKQWNRWRYPERQNKVEDFSRAPADSEDAPWEHRAKQIFGLRQKFSDLCNDELLNLGINRLLDPRRYEEMGITQEPCEKLGPAGSALQAAGVAIEKDIRNAERTYNRAFADALLQSTARKHRRDRVLKKVDAARNWLAASGETPEVLETLDSLTASFDTVSAIVGNQEEERDLLLLTIKMACSRPHKTAQYCERLLAAIDDGSATRSEEKMASLVEVRLREANQYIDQADLTLEEYQHLTRKGEELAAQVNKLEAALGQLDRIVSDDDAPFVQAHAFDEAKATPRDILPVTNEQRQARDRRSKAVAAYFASPLDYEEEWDNVFNRINAEGVEIKAPDEGRKLGYHVPSIAREDLEMLLNPIFFTRSQARLKGIYDIRRFKKSREEMKGIVGPDIRDLPLAVEPDETPVGSERPDDVVISSEIAAIELVVEVDDLQAVEVAPPVGGKQLEDTGASGQFKPEGGLAPRVVPSMQQTVTRGDEASLGEANDLDGGLLNEPLAAARISEPVAAMKEGIDYEALGQAAVAKASEEGQKAVIEWMGSLTDEYEDDYLPITRENGRLAVDIAGAADDLRKEIFPSHPLVIERLRREFQERREDVLLLLQSYSSAVVKMVNGEPEFDKKVFPPGHWRFLSDLVANDQLVADEVQRNACLPPRPTVPVSRQADRAVSIARLAGPSLTPEEHRHQQAKERGTGR